MNTACEKALQWVHKNTIRNKGVLISSKRKSPYPEVTGYFIPTLYQWKEVELANSMVRWLMKEQNDDGSISAPDGVPYTFDTGQVLRGFSAAFGFVQGVEDSTRRACQWILRQIQIDGRLSTPSTDMWDARVDDRIHLYVLPALVEAGEKLNEPKYAQASKYVLGHYKHQKNLIEFNNLSHFYAYILEALCDLGEIDLAKKSMKERILPLQREDGAVPAYVNVPWVCTTGVSQLAVIGYKLGLKEFSDRALQYVERIQNKSGGFYGSLEEGADYFFKEEISWAVKYFLDAHYWKKQRA